MSCDVMSSDACWVLILAHLIREKGAFRKFIFHQSLLDFFVEKVDTFSFFFFF